MAVDERARFALYERLEGALGTEAATTLLEHLPPVGWADVATKRDLDQLEQRIDARFHGVDARFTSVDARFTSIDARFDAVDARFDAVDARFDALEVRIDDRIEACEQRLLAAFRGELVAAVVGQTRTTIFAMAGTVVSVGGLVLAAARLG